MIDGSSSITTSASDTFWSSVVGLAITSSNTCVLVMLSAILAEADIAFLVEIHATLAWAGKVTSVASASDVRPPPCVCHSCGTGGTTLSALRIALSGRTGG